MISLPYITIAVLLLILGMWIIDAIKLREMRKHADELIGRMRNEEGADNTGDRTDNRP